MTKKISVIKIVALLISLPAIVLLAVFKPVSQYRPGKKHYSSFPIYY